MNNPLVSIIIPTYNRAHLIGETLDSVLAQTYENWECIIVDDGSTDNTGEVLNEYLKKDSRFLHHPRPIDRPKGANACRNYGFELSKGEYLNWFDSDDVMMPDFILKRIVKFNVDTQFVIGSMCVWYIDSNDKKIIELKIKYNLFKDYLLWELKIITNSILFRKTFLVDKELFSPKIKRGQETEFFSRLFYKLPKTDYKICNIPLFFYRQHSESKTFKNNDYVKSYKESQTFIAIENLKRSIDIGDLDLIRFYYYGLIEYYFRGLDNKHYKNSGYIIKKLTPQLWEINRQLAIKFYLLGYFFLVIKRGSCKIERYFKKYKLV